jgi:hypothetical protein
MSDDQGTGMSEEKAKRILEIVDEQQHELDLAWQPIRPVVAGYQCSHLTLRGWFALIAAKSRIIYDNSNYRLSDIAALIALISGTSDSPESICESVYKADQAGQTGEMIEAVDLVITHAFAQAPRSGNSAGTAQQIPCTSTAAAVIDQLASQYGWTPDVIFGLPVAQLWQLQREILMRCRGKEGRAMIVTPAEEQVLKIVDSDAIPRG